MCNDGPSCARKMCFFGHNEEELRKPDKRFDPQPPPPPPRQQQQQQQQDEQLPLQHSGSLPDAEVAAAAAAGTGPLMPLSDGPAHPSSPKGMAAALQRQQVLLQLVASQPGSEQIVQEVRLHQQRQQQRLSMQRQPSPAAAPLRTSLDAGLRTQHVLSSTQRVDARSAQGYGRVSPVLPGTAALASQQWVLQHGQASSQQYKRGMPGHMGPSDHLAWQLQRQQQQQQQAVAASQVNAALAQPNYWGNHTGQQVLPFLPQQQHSIPSSQVQHVDSIHSTLAAGSRQQALLQQLALQQQADMSLGSSQLQRPLGSSTSGSAALYPHHSGHSSYMLAEPAASAVPSSGWPYSQPGSHYTGASQD
jgi:hypothetical protein